MLMAHKLLVVKQIAFTVSPLKDRRVAPSIDWLLCHGKARQVSDIIGLGVIEHGSGKRVAGILGYRSVI